MMNTAAAIQWDEQLIQRYDRPGPRYTSYPTAPQFNEHFSSEHFTAAITRGNKAGRPLSLYFHLPFCETVCYYCACNKVITANKKRVEPYLLNLAAEIAQVAQLLDPRREVQQLHWGGGTPTYLNDHQAAWLMVVIRSYFQLQSDDRGEYSIEVHPGLTQANTIEHLREIGFNRLSLGVQDFDPLVQTAVNRFNSAEQVASLVDRARAMAFRSISMDLIYGLPKQNPEKFSRTLDQVISISPDRLSLFNYAHMPLHFKTQRQINVDDLPSAEEKFTLLAMSIEKLTGAGYVYIGMDHFAKPDDELTVAQRKGKLQRNFQGYSTCGGSDLFAFGVSAISAIDDVYVQNTKEITSYSQQLEAGTSPLAKGCQLSKDDRIRRSVINQLICHFHLDFAEIDAEFSIQFEQYFANELKNLQAMASDGLVLITDSNIDVNPTGRLLIRHICMVFDAYHSGNQPGNQSSIPYSRII